MDSHDTFAHSKQDYFTGTGAALWLPPCLWGNSAGYGWDLLNITVTSSWTRWRLKSPSFRWFAQPFVQAQIKNSNLRIDRWMPLKGPVTRKMFPCDDVIMGKHDERQPNANRVHNHLNRCKMELYKTKYIDIAQATMSPDYRTIRSQACHGEIHLDFFEWVKYRFAI